jgi:lysophospholipase L1-like esterase
MTTETVRQALAGAPWKRFVAIGDSITEGYGMDPVEGVEQLPWAERVARALREARPELEFVNLGRRNLGAAQVRESQLERALELEPDLVSIAAGANDLLVPEFDPDPIERELESMFAPFAERGATIFTYTYMRITDSGLFQPEAAAWLSARMEQLHRATRAVAERHGALLVDLWARPDTGDAGLFSRDLKHSNARGQLLVAEATLETLARHVQEPT